MKYNFQLNSEWVVEFQPKQLFAQFMCFRFYDRQLFMYSHFKLFSRLLINME